MCELSHFYYIYWTDDLMHSASMYLSEARSGLYTTSHPRLHSLRSLSLGLLRVYLSEALGLSYITMRFNGRPLTLPSRPCSRIKLGTHSPQKSLAKPQRTQSYLVRNHRNIIE